MDQSQDRRAIAALKAIIQTMMPEFYLMQYGGLPKENFLESLEKDEAIAMAISNEFTESEIDDAFGWTKMGSEGGEAELRATPITPFLNAEQTERLRASMAASQLGYGARDARPFFVLLTLFASWAAGAMVWSAKHASGRQDPLRAVSASGRGRVLV